MVQPVAALLVLVQLAPLANEIDSMSARTGLQKPECATEIRSAVTTANQKRDHSRICHCLCGVCVSTYR